MEKILVVDDEKSMRDFLALVLKKEGYFVAVASDGQEAIQTLQKDIFDLVITDLKMPKQSGIDVLKVVKETAGETLVIMITAFASTETAVDALKQGAYDYITKPFQIEEVKLIIRNALEKRRLRAENLLLRRELKGLGTFENIIGKSEKMQKVFEVVRKVADTNSNVLILGESGTGKELVARAIHFNSRRKDKPFVTVNCSALPETLLESELFGHMKGSFTGAVNNKEGLFEVASGGTIFLDEIGETPSPIQVKLLRVLQEKEFRRIGGTKDVRVDVRIIAATNKDLNRAVEEGSFREDLYYRLDVIPIHLPPLRERSEDIPILVQHFLTKFSQATGKNVQGITPEAIQLLKAQEWRGNVRELENVIERVMALLGPSRRKDDMITPEDLGGCFQKPSQKEPWALQLPDEGLNLEEFLNQLECEFLLKALERTRWVKKEAAKLLQMDFRAFRYRLAKHKVAPQNKSSS